jgi:hypothetical protein
LPANTAARLFRRGGINPAIDGFLIFHSKGFFAPAIFWAVLPAGNPDIPDPCPGGLIEDG